MKLLLLSLGFLALNKVADYGKRKLLSSPNCYKQGDLLYVENLDGYGCVWHTPNYEGPGEVLENTFPMQVDYVGNLELYTDSQCSNYAMEIQCQDLGDGTPSPTSSPTTPAPTTASPTKAPTTPVPTSSPTTPVPTTASPTKAPTTPVPTSSPTTPSPTTEPEEVEYIYPTCYLENGVFYGLVLDDYGCGWHTPNYENWGNHIIVDGKMEFESNYAGSLELYTDEECNNYAMILVCTDGKPDAPDPTPTTTPAPAPVTTTTQAPVPTPQPTTPTPTTPAPTYNIDIPEDEPFCYRVGGKMITAVNLENVDCVHYTSHYKDGIDTSNTNTFTKDYVLGEPAPSLELYTGGIDIIGWSRSCIGTWIGNIPCIDADDVEPVLPQGNKRAVYLWEHLFDNKNVDRIYQAITNDPDFNFNTIKIAMDDDMTPHRQLYDRLKASHPDMEITLDISNNKLLDDFSKIDEQLDLMYTYFGDVLDDIPTISIDFEPHAHFNRKDQFTGEPIYQNPTWPEDNDYYLRIYIDLIKAIKVKLPDKRFCVATPTFFPAWTIFELYDISDCIYIMYYETFNSGKDEQVRDIHSVFISKESYIILQSVDFPNAQHPGLDKFEALQAEFDRISAMSTITNLGLLDLEKRIDFLDAR